MPPEGGVAMGSGSERVGRWPRAGFCCLAPQDIADTRRSKNPSRWPGPYFAHRSTSDPISFDLVIGK